MAIGFMNNNAQTTSAWCTSTYYNALVAVRVDSPTNPPAGFVLPVITPPAYALDIDVRK